jgi:hypothetical protein
MSKINFSPSSGLLPSLLGRRFRLGDDPEIYVALGLMGIDNTVVLQAESTEEIKKITKSEFLETATRADE